MATKSNTITVVDIIGNPANYPTAWTASGVYGNMLIVAEDDTSLLPNGVLDNFKLSRKANATPLLCLRSTDNGTTWTSFTPTFSATTNAITLTDEPAGNLVLVYYQTKTSIAVPDVNSEVLAIGDIIGANGHEKDNGLASLANSLIGKTMTSATLNATYGYWTTMKFSQSPSIDSSTKLLKSTARDSFYGKHPNIYLSGSTSPACKVFPYLTRKNGKAYLNLVFKEMKYGSYLAPTVVTEASATYTQNMTYKINTPGSALDGKVIKWVVATITQPIDWTRFDISPSGVPYVISSGEVVTIFKIYDGDSWGDDSKFNIVDNVSTTLDDNGQTVLIGQKTVELPYFIGADE